jgi:hypothetical protein
VRRRLVKVCVKTEEEQLHLVSLLKKTPPGRTPVGVAVRAAVPAFGLRGGELLQIAGDVKAGLVPRRETVGATTRTTAARTGRGDDDEGDDGDPLRRRRRRSATHPAARATAATTTLTTTRRRQSPSGLQRFRWPAVSGAGRARSSESAV